LEVITTVMTAPYLVYFVFVLREASNLSEVRFGDVAVLKLFSVLHRKNSYKFSVYLLDLRFLVHMPQVISKLSLVEHFLIWETENPLKIRPLSAVLLWQISVNIYVCHFIAFFWVLLITELLGKLLQYYLLYMLWFWVETWSKNRLIICYATLMLLIDLCLVLYEGSFQV
jgi:hypothetical protein